MKVDIQEIESCKKKITIEVSRDKVEKEINIAYESLKKTVKIKGFRKGKVPRKILEKYYKQNIQQEVLQKIIPETYRDAIKEYKIQAVGQPLVEDIKIEDKTPLSFTATVDVFPEIELKEYNGLRFTKKKRKVTDDDIETQLKQLQEKFSEFDIVEDKLIEVSDYVVIDIDTIGFKGKEDQVKNRSLIVGSKSLLPEIEDGLLGMKKGEEKEIKSVIAKDFHDKNLAGNEVVFKVTVNEIKKKRLREIDDIFAKEFGECETLADLKVRIKVELEEVMANMSLENLKKDIKTKLVNDNIFDCPQVLVDAQTKTIIEDLKNRNKSENREFNQEEIEKDPKFKQMALEKLKEDMIIDFIADKEGISVSEERLDEEIKKILPKENSNIKVIKSNMKKNGYLESFRSKIEADEVLNFLINKKFEIEEIFDEN